MVFNPQDAKVFKREYKEWGVELTAEVVSFTAYTAELIKNGTLAAVNTGRELLYQNLFQLARDQGETTVAREVINAYAVCNEMLCYGMDTMWTGNIPIKGMDAGYHASCSK